jgi:hypothetical protein
VYIGIIIYLTISRKKVNYKMKNYKTPRSKLMAWAISLSLLGGAVLTPNLQTLAVPSAEIRINPTLPFFDNPQTNPDTCYVWGSIIKASDDNYYICLAPQSGYDPRTLPTPAHWLKLTGTTDISFQVSPPVISIKRREVTESGNYRAGDYVNHNGDYYLCTANDSYYYKPQTPVEWNFCPIKYIGTIKVTK